MADVLKQKTNEENTESFSLERKVLINVGSITQEVK